jgi:RsiW-degrading membrane proteinase PrsW (M82 family)
MTWRRWLQSRTRNPQFLWRMVIAILLVGVIAGGVADSLVTAWITPPPEERIRQSDPEPQPEPAPDPIPEPEPDDPLKPQLEQLERYADRGEWGSLFRAIPAFMVQTWRHVGATTLAVLTGACWPAFAMQAIQPRSARDGRLWLPLIAAVLGVVSIWPTLFLIYWQERVWGLEESEQLANSVRFFVLGVGLREELAKFVCFLPLLPWCVWRRDELAALVLAGCVGLGFAMEENITYIYGTAASATLTRLLMPAPLHMAMTGLLGLAAYRACVWPKEWGPLLVAWFGVIVLAHGLYDVLVGFPDYGFFGVLIFVTLVRQFFKELRPKQALRVEPISLTANFLFCVSTVAAATFVYLSAAVGLEAAGDVLMISIASQAVMVYLFLREMPETMVRA